MNYEELLESNIYCGRATVVATEEFVVEQGKSVKVLGWALPGGEFTRSRERAMSVAAAIDGSIYRGLRRFPARQHAFMRQAA